MPSANATIAYKYAVQYGKPFLVEVVACVFDALWNYDWRGKVLAYPKYWTYRKMIRRSPFVIYVTEKFLQSRYPTSGKSLGCSDVILLPSDEQTLLKRIAKIQNKATEKTILITVAAIDVPYKGQADVIEVLSKLNQNDFEYWIVGQGNPKWLQNLVKAKNMKNIKILGSVKHADIFNLLERADLYVQPSKLEGLPRAVVEAMSVSLPIIGTKRGGIPELLSNDCLYDPKNLKLLNKLLLEFDQNKAIKWAQQNFNRAKDFQQSNLDDKRNKFFKQFLLSEQLFNI
jgi:glycosyltransferase involved in cell wall biosynthesis